METAISQFTYLPQTKAERATFVQMAVDEVLNGDRNPLELEVMLKNLEDTISAIQMFFPNISALHPALLICIHQLFEWLKWYLPGS